jgi:membrane-associated phospholipid phosphatase
MARWLDRVRELDEAIDKRIEPYRTPTLDRLFYGLSSAGDHGLLWHGLGAWRALRRGEPGYALRFSTALGLESALTNGPIKAVFRRGRPQEHYTHAEPLPYGMRRPITSSFPSGHAVTSFMCASVLSKGTRAGPAYFALAALVASSRVYTRIHHASDVVAGAALGLALGHVAKRHL